MPSATPTVFARALRNQLWLIRRGRARTLLIFSIVALSVLLIAVFTIRIPVLHGQDLDGGGMSVKFEWFSESDFGMPEAPGLLAVFMGFMVVMWTAFLWPFVIWSGEPPRERGYHWLMPIERWQHDLARVIAGGVFLLAGMAVVGLCLWVGLVIGGRSAALDVLSGAALVNYLTGPLTVYLLVSVAAIASNRPGRTVFIVWLAITIPQVVFALANVSALDRFFSALVGGPLGYVSALTGGLTGAVSRATAGDTNTWFIAVLIWFVVALVGVVFGLRRRRES